MSAANTESLSNPCLVAPKKILHHLRVVRVCRRNRSDVHKLVPQIFVRFHAIGFGGFDQAVDGNTGTSETFVSIAFRPLLTIDAG